MPILVKTAGRTAVHAFSHLDDADFATYLDRRLADARPMTAREHDVLMDELSRRAQGALPPLAYHAWAAAGFAVRRGLLTEEEADAYGDDPYHLLLALEERGVLDVMERELVEQRRRGTAG